MADKVRMTSRTVFANERITVFPKSGPAEGVKGGAAQVGDEFETDLLHAKDLDRLELADPVDRADLDGEALPLTAHYQVSAPALAADQAARAAAAAAAPAAPSAPATGGASIAAPGTVPTGRKSKPVAA